MSAWPDRIGSRLSGVREAGRWRSIRTLDGRLPVVTVDGVEVVTFAGNDYLGLAGHPEVAAAAHAAIDRWGTGSGASRLVVGGRPVHDELEAELAEWKGAEAAVVLPTGYAANLAVLTSLADGPEVLVVSDELNHASIIDGCRLSRGTTVVARHRDVAHVEELLVAHDGPALVVTDTVFSMDGDEAPVAELVDLCGRHDALLVLDEAHAVLGPTLDLRAASGAGVGVVRVGTLSKALGSLGGFVAASRTVVDLLVNVARPFVFTTAPAPADAAAALAALRIVRGAEGAQRVARLRAHVETVAPGHPSPIVPIVLGDEATALAAAEALLAQGLLVPAIRPPTVAPGTSRLRVALSAAHTEDQVERLAKALADLPRHGRLMLVVCTGTSTDVGKTWVGAALLAELRRRGRTVSARKPAQSFDADEGSPLDGRVLAAATGEDADDVCAPHRTYAVPMAPPMAAAALDQPVPQLDDLLAELRWPEPEPWLRWLELVGGPRSPIASDGDGVDLTARVAPEHVVLVADAGLGTINAVGLSSAPFLDLGLAPIVVLNRFDPAVDVHVRNRAWLVDRHPGPVIADLPALADELEIRAR